MPPSMREWLPGGHLAYFISDTIDAMDIREIEEVYEREERGYPPYHPRMMTKVLVYAYCTGTFSSRKIAKKLYEDVGYRVLSAENQPDFRTVSDFRKRHLASLGRIFKKVLELCRKSGMARLGHVALDGTKQKANASVHKAMSYCRMKEESARLEQEIGELLSQAELVDEEEDKEFGTEVRGDELPKELAFRQGRIAKIKQAMEELEAEARAREAEGQEVQVSGEGGEPKRRGRPKKKPEGVPTDKAQKNFTDPESRVMKAADKSFIQGYNAQAAVDSEYQVIVATMVTDQAADAPHLEPMVERIENNTGQLPEEMSLDAGYYSDGNVKHLEEKGIDGYIAPCRMKHREYRSAVAEPVSEEMTTREHMKAKVLSEEGRRKYGLRKETAEPVFGQIKSCMGFRRFSMRGRDACESEWSFVCAAHNLLKLFRHGAESRARQRTDQAASPLCTASCELQPV